jgi:hypothetical protein
MRFWLKLCGLMLLRRVGSHPSCFYHNVRRESRIFNCILFCTWPKSSLPYNLVSKCTHTTTIPRQKLYIIENPPLNSSCKSKIFRSMTCSECPGKWYNQCKFTCKACPDEKNFTVPQVNLSNDSLSLRSQPIIGYSTQHLCRI